MDHGRRFQVEDDSDQGKPVVLCRAASLEEAETILRDEQSLYPERRLRVSYTTGMRKINKYYPHPTAATSPSTPHSASHRPEPATAR